MFERIFQLVGNLFSKKIGEEPPYIPIGRKLLSVNYIKKNALAVYSKSVNEIAHLINRRGSVPERVVEGEEVIVPPFEIAINPMKRIGEKKSKREMKRRAEESIRISEDIEIFRDISAAADRNQITYSGEISVSALSYAFGSIRSHGYEVKAIAMHPVQAQGFLLYGSDVFSVKRKKKSIWGAKVYESRYITEGTVYFLADKRIVGVISIWQKIKHFKKKDLNNLREGFVSMEQIGICILNSSAVSKIASSPPRREETTATENQRQSQQAENNNSLFD